MNKKFFILSLLILTVPACLKKKRSFVIDQADQSTNNEPVSLNDESLLDDSDEDIGAFVLDEDKNPFTSEALYGDTDEELMLTSTDPSTGDLQKDSANYGLKTIYYDFDHYNIRPDQKASVEHNLKQVKSLVSKGYKVVVEGHACDSAGSPSYNLVLSEDRAKGVADYCEKNGVNMGNLTVVGRGSEMKKVQFGNRQQQAPNRRVEIYAYQQ